MFYSVAIHFLIGMLTGYAFPVRALLGLVAVVLVECLIVAVVFGAAAGLWSLAGLMAIQIGYLGGVYTRSVLEKAGITEPNTHIRHTQ